MPGFASAPYAYNGKCGGDLSVTEVTVTPTPNDSGATIEYLGRVVQRRRSRTSGADTLGVNRTSRWRWLLGDTVKAGPA